MLQQRGAPDQRVAEHALRGADPQAVGLVRTVAARLTETAPGVAAHLPHRVTPLISDVDTDDVITDRAEALFLSGRAQEAEDLIRTYLPRVTSAQERMRLHQVSLRIVTNLGNMAALLGQIDNLLDELSHTSPLRQSRWPLSISVSGVR